MNITTKQFQILTDVNLVWDFLTDIYEKGKENSVKAPFFEYALNSSWMNKKYTFLDRLWFDENKVVAFVFYEAPVTNIYFSVRKGYEFLAEELIDYAQKYMPDFGRQQLVFLNNQQFLKDAAAKMGYRQTGEYWDMNFDFNEELNYRLPEGFHFIDSASADPVKLAKLFWYGFDNHTENGEFINWNAEDNSSDWTPAKGYNGVLSAIMAPAPHATPQYDLLIADDKGEYACFSGMWWIEKNKFAYMEPLCTVPEHRNKGLARAALSRHYQTMKALGAQVMSGGANSFYAGLGFKNATNYTFWQK